MVPSQDSNPWPVNRKSDALPIAQPRHWVNTLLTLKPADSEKYIDKENTSDKQMLILLKKNEKLINN